MNCPRVEARIAVLLNTSVGSPPGHRDETSAIFCTESIEVTQR